MFKMEKKKLKAAFKNVSKISLIIDLWKAKKKSIIKYIVIIGHQIDANWKLQKQVLSFVHILPPHCNVEISDPICKCLIDQEIKKKVYTIFINNAFNNDIAIIYIYIYIRDGFARTKK